MDTVITDKAWFRANPGANYRIREPAPGEVLELADHMLPKEGAWEAGGFRQTEPAPDWRVMAIRLPLGRIARLLSIHVTDVPDVTAVSLTTVGVGSRLALA